jgi:F-type H+-transporting ATPase subunit b
LNPQLIFLLQSLPPGRVFGLDQQTAVQMVIMLISISVFAVLMYVLLYKPVRAFLQKRAEGIKSDLDYAETQKAKANELKLEYEQIVKDIDAEKYEILETARKLSAEKTKESESAAKAEADSIKASAFKEIEAEHERVRDEVRATVFDVSNAMVAKFLPQSMDEGTQKRLFDEAMNELGGTA